MYNFLLLLFNSSILLIFLNVLLLIIWDYTNRKRFLAQLSTDIVVAPYLPIIGSIFLIDDFKNRIKAQKRLTQKICSPSYIFFFSILPYYITKDPDVFQAIIPRFLDRGKFYDILAGDIVNNSLLNSKLTLWKHNRKIMNKTFRQPQLNTFVSIFNEVIEKKINFQKKENCTSLLYKNGNMAFLVSTITLGKQTLEDVESDPFNAYEDLKHINKDLFARGTKPWFYLDFMYKLTKSKKLLDERIERINDFINKRIESLREQQQEIESMGDENFIVNLEKSNVEKNVILAEVNFAFGAAIDTSAFAFSTILILLGMHPDIQDKVLKEVLEVVGEDEPVRYDHLPSLKYTDMVINETLRLFPPIPTIFRKLSSDVCIGNTVLPKNLDILFDIYSLHRDEKYWKNPLEFNPDRFLPSETRERHPYCFMPFSMGPRNCLGFKYAIMFLQTAVALAVRKYKIWSSYKSMEDIRINSYVTTYLEDDDDNYCTFVLRKQEMD